MLKEVNQWLDRKETPSKEEMRGKVRDLHVYRSIFGALDRLPDGTLIYKETLNDYEERNVKRVLVPEASRDEIFQHVHAHATAGHFGQDATVQRAKLRFFYPGMSVDIKARVRSCSACLMKITKESNRVGQHVPRNNSFPGEMIFVDLMN